MRLRPGRWPSPITAESLTVASPSLDEPRADGADTYWLEGRPWERGRVVLVRRDGGTGEVADLTEPPFNVRSRVHEYGGGAYAVRAGLVVFSDFATGRVHRVRAGEEPTPITPEAAVRFGGLVLSGDTVFAVREDHRAGGEPVNTLVALAVEGPNEHLGTVIASGADFYATPAICPVSGAMAHIEWDHPNMPWDSTRLVLDGVVVAGGEGVSVAQPHFAPCGTLWFVSDASGFWNLWRVRDGVAAPVHEFAADCADPQWLLSFVDFTPLDSDRALFRWFEDALPRLGVLDAHTGEHTRLEVEGASMSHVQVADGDLLLRLGHEDRAAQIVRGPLHGLPESLTVLAGPTEGAEPGTLSRPQARSWTNTAGLDAHGFYYPPTNSEVESTDDAPPLLVIVHGGPTSHTETAYRRPIQFWTSRGFAVLDVNHGGSTSYGRAYRERLREQWGVVDIDDCASGVVSLAEAGLIDPDLAFMRGGSAGGYTTLRALTSTSVFAGGTSYYGISDLEQLLVDDHKFESRYTLGLVGPHPQAREVYLERSPVHHVADLHGELLLLQGADDLVVQANQAELMAEAMRAVGKDVELVIYEGEGHGFRQASTIIDSLERELAFYQRLIGS